MIDSCGTVHLPFEKTLEMTSDALTSVGKHVMSNNACAHCWRYTNKIVFGLVQITCVMMLHNFLPFVMTKGHFRWSDKRIVDMSI